MRLIKESRESIPELTGFPDEIILLVAQHLSPSCVVILALTCHRFYAIFSAQTASVSLTDLIWDTYGECEPKDRYPLHHVLKNWGGLAGYKYFDDSDISNLLSTYERPNKYILSDHYFYLWIFGYNPVHCEVDRKKMKPVTGQWKKILGGLFFKLPRSDELINCAGSKLSEKEQSDAAILMQSWTLALKDLQYHLDKHRRLRWSEYLMESYAEWMDLVGF